MAPPKKMTLQEFFTDESFGGSWADDDIDIASISVPIGHNQRNQYRDSFNGGSSYGSYGHGYGGGGRSGGISDNGPPYIIKLLNLPITCDNSFVEDLFKSRYTPYVKFKIVVDPTSNILETKIIKKVAFVELMSNAELAKALKWTDLYYKPTKKVIVEAADFGDFQDCMAFNSEHEEEILEIEEAFRAGKHQHNIHPRSNVDQPTQKSPLHSTPILQRPTERRDSITRKDKPNPFGVAKPVDVLAKQHEIEDKLITVNHTTIKTAGALNAEAKAHAKAKTGIKGRRHSNSQRPYDVASANESTDHANEHRDSPVPKSVYDDGGMSLAQLLSGKDENGLSSSINKKSPTPDKAANAKPKKIKPVILKKKVQSSPLTATAVLASDIQHENGEEPVKEQLVESKEEKSPIASTVVVASDQYESAKTSPSDGEEKGTVHSTSNEDVGVKKHNGPNVHSGSKAELAKSDLTESEEVTKFKEHLINLTKKPHNAKRKVNKNQNNSKQPNNTAYRNKGSAHDIKDGTLGHQEGKKSHVPEKLHEEKFDDDSKGFPGKRKPRGKTLKTKNTHLKDATNDSQSEVNGKRDFHRASDKNNFEGYSRKSSTHEAEFGKRQDKKGQPKTDGLPPSNGVKEKQVASESQQPGNGKSRDRSTPVQGEAEGQDHVDNNKPKSSTGGHYKSTRGNFRHRGRGANRGGMNFNLHYVRGQTENKGQPST